MDLGERRRLRREQLRAEHGTTKVLAEDNTTTAWIAMALIIAGSMIGGFAHMPIATALSNLYCTPESCAALPQVLTGRAVAVAVAPMSLTYFLVGMLFVPFTIGIAWLVRPARRVLTVAGLHWLLLLVLILWLA